MRPFLFALLLVFAVPSSFAQKTDDKSSEAAAPHPLVGTWDYVVRPADPLAQGTFTIRVEDGMLGGTFMTDAARPIDPFEAEGDALGFSFKQPGMGTIAIRGTLDGDRFEGEAQPGDQDAVPFVATRHTETEPSDQ